jgi:hypothetical protein
LFKGLLEQSSAGNSKLELALKTGDKTSTPVLLSISTLGHTDTPGTVCMV